MDMAHATTRSEDVSASRATRQTVAETRNVQIIVAALGSVTKRQENANATRGQ